MPWLYWLLGKIWSMLRNSKTGDVRVFGLVSPTHLIEDIGRDVPHGVTVIIPGDLAIQSKDLWRAINQKCIFQLPSASPPAQSGISSHEKERLEAQVLALLAQVKALETQNQLLRESLQSGSRDHDQKLDTILSTLKNVAVFGPRGVSKVGVSSEGVDGTAPMFIPKEIRPKDIAAVRIDIQGESAPSSVSDAADRLRKVRKGEV